MIKVILIQIKGVQEVVQGEVQEVVQKVVQKAVHKALNSIMKLNIRNQSSTLMSNMSNGRSLSMHSISMRPGASSECSRTPLSKVLTGLSITEFSSISSLLSWCSSTHLRPGPPIYSVTSKFIPYACVYSPSMQLCYDLTDAGLQIQST